MTEVVSDHVGRGIIENSESGTAANEGRSRRLKMLEPGGFLVQTRHKSPII